MMAINKCRLGSNGHKLAASAKSNAAKAIVGPSNEMRDGVGTDDRSGRVEKNKTKQKSVVPAGWTSIVANWLHSVATTAPNGPRAAPITIPPDEHSKNPVKPGKTQ